jgi:hypothetical protein
MIRKNVIELLNNKTVSIDAIDSSRLLINTSNVAFLDIIKNKDNNVEGISFEGKETILLDDEIEVLIGAVKSIYKIRGILVSNDKKSVLLFSTFKNKTTSYLLPILGKTLTSLKFNSYFINAFIDESKLYIGLLYRYTGTNLYKEFENELSKDSNYIKHIEVSPYEVMYIFRISEMYHEDIKQFFEGNYSKFSKSLKMKISAFYSLTKDSYQYQVLNKSENLRKKLEADLGCNISEDAELVSKPIFEQETFKLT